MTLAPQTPAPEPVPAPAAAAPRPAPAFSARLPFPHLVPYDELFRERIPLLLALQVAIGNYRSNRSGRRDLREDRARAIDGRLVESRFHAAECGVYSGNSLRATAQTLADAGLDFLLVGLDTFEGLPELSQDDLLRAPEGAPYLSRRLFADTSLPKVASAMAATGNDPGRIWLLKGLFEHTLPQLPDRHYHFVNIDCDLYEPHLQCLSYFYPRMEPGGVIFFDDFHSVSYPMAGDAIRAFFADKPERIAHLRYGDDGENLTKSFVVRF